MTFYTISSSIADEAPHGMRTALRLYHGKHYASREVAMEAALRLLRAALWVNMPRIGRPDEWYTAAKLSACDGLSPVYERSGEFGYGNVEIAETEHGVRATCELLIRTRGRWTESRYIPRADGLFDRESARFIPPSPWASVVRRYYRPFSAMSEYVPVIVELDVYVSAVEVLDVVPDYTGEDR